MPQETLAVAASAEADGGGAQYEPPAKGKGYIDDAVFDDIAEAIRERNGETTRYKPREMAPAILALKNREPKARALLLKDGTFEFTFLKDAKSPSGGEVVREYGVPTVPQTKEQTPWSTLVERIKRVVFDESFAEADVTNIDYWFYMIHYLKEVRGLENLPNVTSANSTFAFSPMLTSLYATKGFETSIVQGKDTVMGCAALVGGENDWAGTIEDFDYTALRHGAGGMLTDPTDDHRNLVYTYVYEDGELVMTTEEGSEPGRRPISEGKFLMQAKLHLADNMPYADAASSITHATLKGNVNKYPNNVYMDSWFGKLPALESINGMANVTGVISMNGTFLHSTSIETIDLRGIDPAKIGDLGSAFYGCKALRTIMVDPSWKLADGVGERFDLTFGECEQLVGGSGSNIRTAGTGSMYARIDSPDAPGLLTAG